MSSRERQALRERRAQGLVGVLFSLVGVTGVGFVLAFTSDTSAYLAVLAGFACLVVAGGLSVLAWHRESVAVAGQQLRWRRVRALGILAQTAAAGFLVVPVNAARDALLGAVVFVPLVLVGGVSLYVGLVGPRFDIESEPRLAVAGLLVFVLFLGAYVVAFVSV